MIESGAEGGDLVSVRSWTLWSVIGELRLISEWERFADWGWLKDELFVLAGRLEGAVVREEEDEG